MKALLAAFIILVFLHLIAAVGFIGWLGATDRVNGERLQQVVDVFTPTIAQEEQSRLDAELAAAEAEAVRQQLVRLENVADGPKTLEDRLMENFEDDEFDLHRLERLNSETEAIRRRLDQDKQLIAKEWADFEKRETEFQEMVARRTAVMQEEDFKRAVKTLEQLPPKQAKQMVQQYIADGKIDDAVDYLAAMQLRKSAAVLKAFKAEEDIPQAAELLQKLRDRGKDPFGGAEAGGGKAAAL
ncbi:MAG: hypothetical protein AAF333_12495 [Planctomycetota bacterium]